MSTGVRNASMVLGVMAVVGGVSAMLFSLRDLTVTVPGWGPFSGSWQPIDYYTIGTALTVAGSGLITYWLLTRPRTPTMD